MKKLLLSAIFIPVISYAISNQTISPFPDAKDGINIWPSKKMNIPVKNKFNSFADKQYNEATWTNDWVESLFEISKIGKSEAAHYDKVSDQTDTHLKSDISKIKLSFKFDGIPNVGKDNILGFAPSGSYNKNGWTGVVEYFQTPELGVCSFTTFAIKSVILAKESILYSINNKPTENDISGNYTNGFLYHVDWYTNTRKNSFKCANKELKPTILKSMTEIAKSIDKSTRQEY